MKTLFEQLTPENQQLTQNHGIHLDLMISLNKHNYFNQLTATDLYSIAEIFGFISYDISFTKALLSISELFKG